MSYQTSLITLNNGNKIPGISIIGTGTRWYKYNPEDKYSDALVKQIENALELPGMLHIDCAEMYQTHAEVGEALRNSKKPRDEIFITDKYAIPRKFSSNPKEGLKLALEKMGLEYVDLYLLHFPIIDPKLYDFTLEEAWKMMEDLYNEGLAKNIGVSNFRVEDLEQLSKSWVIKPQINQIEFNAYLQNQTPGIYDYCIKNNIQLEAFCPLVPLREVNEKDLLPLYVKQLAQKYSKTENQIMLRWVSQRKVIPVTTSSRPERVRDAYDIFSFELTQDEVEFITKLGSQHDTIRKYWNVYYDKYN
ncbi:hypothetical protein TBLA_0F01980 [Henningerozyma blattae CBS 6284]|uniref:NADP-dependent oxidoreductase domain-containing protein n=1 Tax=Henningerozyma blattae (strain ATCC 34711 / CBS 6284 / DSM 70876 / NBRC 10599 / NRRL Y-10934 / UCD 77-7) TaxID=1071380 RepID=I2H5T8_HENB6|nr:hypothetical protein TBLA_0F01980 [Tetrapisispora blattae CBS 6284]CCH61740.1 hypothetical protein TBLA_0F01980 [Tetrapisispora blattae CBS 6284]